MKIHESDVYVQNCSLVLISFLKNIEISALCDALDENRRSGRRFRWENGHLKRVANFCTFVCGEMFESVLRVWAVTRSRLFYSSKCTTVLFCSLHLFDLEDVIRMNVLEDKY